MIGDMGDRAWFLVGSFRERARRDPAVAVVRWCRALEELQRRTLTMIEEADATEALSDRTLDPDEREEQAMRLDLLASCLPVDEGSGGDLHQLASTLRAGGASSRGPSSRAVRAAQIAAACWQEGVPEDRLRHIDRALAEIGALAEEAGSEGDEAERITIGRHAESVLRLRLLLEGPG